MKIARINLYLFALRATGAIALTLTPAVVAAQHTTTSSVRSGDPSHEVIVKNAQVVYVEGNDLVVKLDSGRIEHMVVPANERFFVDGREGSLSDLKPGARLMQTITTSTTPRVVQNVQVVKGKVWHVNAPSMVIVTLPDGNNHAFRVPSHAKFTVNGKPKSVFDLRKGMTFEATTVTDVPERVVTTQKMNVAYTPTPAMQGVLLIGLPDRPAPELVASVSAEHADPQGMLPKTASAVPLFGLLGAAGILSSLGLTLRRKFLGVKA